MKLILRLLPFTLLFNLSCKDDLPAVKKMTYDVIFQVNFTLDGVQYSKVYGKDTANIAYPMGYNPVNGEEYQARGASFEFKNPFNYFNISIGSIHGTREKDWPAAYESFKSNFAPGDKAFEYLLFNSSTLPNKVEITWRDEQGQDWYSTKYTNTPYAAEIIQPSGKFTITEMREIKNELSEEILLIVKGKFNCKLYEWDGPGVKDLEDGSFVALVSF